MGLWRGARYAPRTLRTWTLLPLAIVLGATPALAQPEHPPLPRALQLDYVLGPGTERCPAAYFFEGSLRTRMRFNALVAGASARLVVTIRRVKGTYDGLVEVRDSEGRGLWSFTIPVPNCRSLNEALAFAASQELDPPGPLPEPEPDPPSPSEPTTQSPPKPPPPRAGRMRNPRQSAPRASGRRRRPQTG